MKHLEGMKDGAAAAKKHSKSSKKSESKKHHPFKRTVIDHHGNGSHTTMHEHETDPMQNVSYGTPDHDSMMDGMMANTSQPNPGEAQAAAPAGPMASAPPAMPGAPA